MKSLNKGFTLIELMVVIVIIGILAALAIPKMLGVSAKAKASEAPTAISNYETLQSAYLQETGALGTAGSAGFKGSVSKWWSTTDTATAGLVSMTTKTNAVGDCAASTKILTSQWTTADTATHTKAGAAGCQAYFPNF